jgi:hypothetical protein
VSFASPGRPSKFFVLTANFIVGHLVFETIFHWLVLNMVSKTKSRQYLPRFVCTLRQNKDGGAERVEPLSLASRTRGAVEAS